MKISATNFKGIEYVQLSQLPDEQRAKIFESLNRNFIIKILIEGKIVGNCIQYKDYEFWYDNIFHAKRSGLGEKSMEEESVTVNMAFQQ